jgi:hypothetical protein
MMGVRGNERTAGGGQRAGTDERTADSGQRAAYSGQRTAPDSSRKLAWRPSSDRYHDARAASPKVYIEP